MKFLDNSKLINKEIKRLIKNYENISWAVAWVTIGFDCYETFLKNKSKFEKIIVGIHFYQTHPDFIRHVIDDPNTRFILNPNGVFHPKLYLFENDSKDWECIIGSPNFTKSAFATNSETAMLFSNSDEGSDDAYFDIKRTIDDYWNDAKKITEIELIEYEKIWKRKQKSLKKLTGHYDGLEKKHKSPLDIKTFKMAWEEYFNKVNKDKYYRDRIQIIVEAQDIFSKYEHFKDISLESRKKIAGIMSPDKPDWMLFGSMKGAGYYNREIGKNNIHISKALDFIPILGEIKKIDFLHFIEEFRKAFPNDGDGCGIAASTRLLAMKRPDYFICLNTKNIPNFSQDFGTKKTIKIDDYWDIVIERIIDCEWWNSDKPTHGEENIVWNGRAAFLDSIYYDKSI